MHNQIEELEKILALPVRETIKKAHLQLEALQEIRLGIARPLTLWYRGRELFLTEEGRETLESHRAKKITEQEVRETLEFAGKYSLYAYEDELRQGYLTLPGGHRLGIAGKVILVSVICQVLKHSGREEQAFLTSLAGLVLVLFWILPYIFELFDTMKQLFAL